jgi:broad specificity phosphatase PhoE
MRRLTLLVAAPTAAARSGRFPTVDEPLDDAGRAAAAALGAAPRPGWSSERIVSAPEARARQTAEALGRSAAVERALADLDVGGWCGRDLAAVVAEQPDAARAWRADPSAVPHGGEAIEALLDRVRGWLAGLGADPATPTVLAVTHPAVVRAAVLDVLRGAPSAFWSVDAAPLTTTTLTHDGSRWSLRAHGADPSPV